MSEQLELPLVSRRPTRAQPRRGPASRTTVAPSSGPPAPTASVVVRPSSEARIEALARAALGRKVLVKLTQNRSTMISCSRRNGVLYVRMHAIFSEAPDTLLDAAVRYTAGRPTRPEENAQIDAWIDQHRHLVKKSEGPTALQPVGEVYDLQEMLDRLNARYFDDRIQSRITWSRSLRKRRRRTIRLGSYCDEQRLIRIHPALDQDFVPAYFVESVVFHEMLHEVHGATKDANGRREIHSAAFLEDERRFESHARARRWEAKHLGRLLKY